MRKSKHIANDRPRDGKRAPRGAKSKTATLARKQQRAAKRTLRDGR